MTDKPEPSSDPRPSHAAVAAAAGAIASSVAEMPKARARGVRAPVAKDETAAAVDRALPLRAPVEVAAPSDLRAPELYLNRELTWLAFNRRVLYEARDLRTPLLERVKFLAIANSNLDEFFMKRIGGLKQQVAAGMHNLTVDGRTPEQQISECVAVIKELTPELRD
ncbi:MAG TPA: hypothetical protein VLE23_03985, partial [Geminicoccaceae bacterium]|nr:hypothetical protein [Geminicoccaceae bacterium]